MKVDMATSKGVKARWMVVDDDAGLREFMAALLETTGSVEAVCFDSGEAALAAYRNAGAAFAFIITDYEMPGMNGAEFCRALRQLQPSAEILLMTGNPNISEAQACDWGFCGLLRKPFSAVSLWRSTGIAEELAAGPEKF